MAAVKYSARRLPPSALQCWMSKAPGKGGGGSVPVNCKALTHSEHFSSVTIQNDADAFYDVEITFVIVSYVYVEIAFILR